jgi:REP element-mobilizing transposase RayT
VQCIKFVRTEKTAKNQLPGFDYSSNGGYFVTICVKNRIPYFGTIQKGIMTLNTYGEIVLEKWKWLEQQYKYVQLGNCIVMPNHFHGIIFINNSVGTGRNLSLQKTKIKSLSELIDAFKTVSSKEINKIKQIPRFSLAKIFL